jgi:hypothetical protein
VRWSVIWLAEAPPPGLYRFFVAGPDSEQRIGSFTCGQDRP